MLKDYQKKIERDFFIFFHSFSNLFFLAKVCSHNLGDDDLKEKKARKDQKEIQQAKISKGDFSGECWPLTNLSNTAYSASQLTLEMHSKKCPCFVIVTSRSQKIHTRKQFLAFLRIIVVMELTGVGLWSDAPRLVMCCQFSFMSDSRDFST